MRLILFFIAFISFCYNSYSQEYNLNDVDHFETIIFDNDEWRYFLPTEDNIQDWKDLTFNDSLWNIGSGGIGYGDNDDYTITEETNTLLLRKKFFLYETENISSSFLNANFDDGFIAYINGVEIARENIGNDSLIFFNQLADSCIESNITQNQSLKYFYIDDLSSILNVGENILSIQVHNCSNSSSDLSANYFLTIGVSDTSFSYYNPPNWFSPIFNLTFSELPIIKIYTNGAQINDSNRVICDMKVVSNSNDSLNYFASNIYSYDGKVNIEYRGSSSQNMPKKAFSFETQFEDGSNNNVTLVNLPIENDWILYAPYIDKSLIRNSLTYSLARQMNIYSSRTKHCELLIDDEYQGVYVLMEKIKKDQNRVNIATLNPEEIFSDDVTGGYILKIDKFTDSSENDSTYWQSQYLDDQGLNYIKFQYHYPKFQNLANEQKTYIHNFMNDFETTLFSNNYGDQVNGYQNFINVKSFIDFILLNEFSKNGDAYKFSTYFHKDKESNGGKIKMGPFWDFDRAYGNYWPTDLYNTDGWRYNNSGSGPFWFKKLLADSIFENKLNCRWQELKLNVLNPENTSAIIDSLINNLGDSRKRNYIRWSNINETNGVSYYQFNSYHQEVDFLKFWIENRFDWLDSTLSNNCDSIEGCIDQEACNYNFYATISDYSCEYPINEFYDCNGNCLFDMDNDGICDQQEAESFLCQNNFCSTIYDQTGEFKSLQECEIVCNITIEDSWNCVNDACIEPMDGAGFYDDLNECEAVCNAIADSWNCENNACVDPLDGTGIYGSLEECEANCNATSIVETNLDINIYPNPSSNIFNLEFNSDSGTEILVTNVLGEQVYFESVQSVGEFNTQIDLSNYSKGIYNLTIKKTNGISNHKLILQ